MSLTDKGQILFSGHSEKKRSDWSRTKKLLGSPLVRKEFHVTGSCLAFSFFRGGNKIYGIENTILNEETNV